MIEIKELLFKEFLCSDRRQRNHFKIKTMRGLDPEDLQAEFDLGALLSLDQCNPAEDPLKYLALSGFNRVRHVMQAHLRANLFQECVHCGKSRMYRYRSPCVKCGQKDFRNISRFEPLDTVEGRV